jgi:hypothetical protein
MNLTNLHQDLKQKHITGVYKIIEFLYLVVAWIIFFIKPSLYNNQTFLFGFLIVALLFFIHHIYLYLYS